MCIRDSTESDPFTVVKPHFAKWHVFEGPEPVTKVTCEVADASVSNSYFTAKVCSNVDIVRRLHKGDCTVSPNTPAQLC